MIEISKDWCCELCGEIIKGNCNNVNGYVTHIDSCIVEDEKRNKRRNK